MNLRYLPSAATPLGLLVLLSLAVKGAAILLGPAINPDGVRYINAAHEFQAGNFSLGFSYVGDMPFYPLLLAGIQFIIPDWVLAGQILSTLGLTLAVIPLYLLTRDLFGGPAALWTGLAFVLSPVLNEYAAEVLRDPLFIFFLLWGVWFGLLALRNLSISLVVLSSVCAFLAVLLRVEGILFFPVFFIAILWSAWRQGRFRAILLRGAVLTCVPGLILLALVLPFQEEVVKVFSGNHGIGVFSQDLMRLNLLGTYPEVYASLKDWERTLPNAHWSSDLAEIVRHNIPLIYLLGFIEALVATLYPLFALLVLVGLSRQPARGHGYRFVLALAATFLAAAYFVLFHRNFLSNRYILAPAVLLLPWLGAGVEFLRQACRGTGWARFAHLLVGVAIVLPLWANAAKWGKGGAVLKESGIWLAASQDLENSRVICNDERIPFYAGRWRGDYLTLSTRDFAEMERLALENGGDLLVIETSARNRATLPVPANFDLLREFYDKKNLVRIYRRKI
jgi:4-amino-4-deoxy-L-arabinose transferase-like glycosyltransferase